MAGNETIDLMPVWNAIESIQDRRLRYVLEHAWLTALSSLSLDKSVAVKHSFLKSMMAGNDPTPLDDADYLTGPEFLASLDRCCDKHTPEEALAAIKDIEEG